MHYAEGCRVCGPACEPCCLPYKTGTVAEDVVLAQEEEEEEDTACPTCGRPTCLDAPYSTADLRKALTEALAALDVIEAGAASVDAALEDE